MSRHPVQSASELPLSPRASYPDEHHSKLGKSATFNLEKTYAWELWNLEESQKLVEKARNSEFIKGIRSGDLDAQKYGIYMLQDAVYLAKALENFTIIQHNPHNEAVQVNGTFPLREYYAKKVLSYTHYRDTMLKAWHVIQPDSIRLSAAVRDYISFEAAVVADYESTPWFYALANFPCFMLWPTLANELADVPDLSKAYARWVNDNKDETYSSAAKLAELLELFRPSFEDADGAHAKKVFLTALQYEVDFFNSVKLDE